MKFFYNHYIHVIFLFLFIVTSCHDDKVLSNPLEGDEISDEILDKVCIEWDSSKDEVGRYMKSFVKAYDSDEMLKYRTKNDSYTISYQFVDNYLTTSILSIPLSETTDDTKIYNLDGFNYIGNVDGSQIYSSQEKNTMGIIMDRNANGKNYKVIGFAPLSSSAFEEYEPISVTTLPATALGSGEFTMNARVDGLSTCPNVHFELSESSDMSSSKKYTATINGFEACATAKRMKNNTTYYFRAYISYESVQYYGNVQSVNLGF